MFYAQSASTVISGRHLQRENVEQSVSVHDLIRPIGFCVENEHPCFRGIGMVSHVATSTSAGSAQSVLIVVQAGARVGFVVVDVDTGIEVKHGHHVATHQSQGYIWKK